MAGKSIEERLALIDEKIEKKRSEIEVLEAQKQKLLHPISMRAVLTKAKEVGMTPQEVADKLGIDV